MNWSVDCGTVDPQEILLYEASKEVGCMRVTATNGHSKIGYLRPGSMAEYSIRHSLIPVIPLPLKKKQ
jgi:hypothetical protein